MIYVLIVLYYSPVLQQNWYKMTVCAVLTCSTSACVTKWPWMDQIQSPHRELLWGT